MITRRTMAPDDARDDADDPMDPDIDLIVRFLGNALTEEQDDEVEERFASDPAFAEKVGPILYIWNLPIDFRAAYYDYLRAHPEARPSVRSSERPPAASYMPFGPFSPPTPSASPSSARRLFTYWRHPMTYNVALVLAMLATPAAMMYLKYGSSHLTVVEAGDTRATGSGKGWRQQQTETQQGEERTATLRNGSKLVMRPGANTIFQYPMPNFGARVTLQGEAVVQVSPAERFVELRTSAGVALLTPGLYAVRCEADCKAMLITVVTGVANIHSDTAKHVSATLRAGEFGRVRRGGQGEKVGADAADGYPTTDVKPKSPR